MSTEEQKLNELTQTSPQGHNPFLVPDGYYSTIHTRVMDKIKQIEAKQEQSGSDATRTEQCYHSSLSLHARQQGVTLWKRMTVAAMFTGLFSVIGTMLYRQHINTQSPPVEKNISMSTITDIEYDDELLDYAMLSNCDIEYYLTSVE